MAGEAFYKGGKIRTLFQSGTDWVYVRCEDYDGLLPTHCLCNAQGDMTDYHRFYRPLSSVPYGGNHLLTDSIIRDIKDYFVWLEKLRNRLRLAYNRLPRAMRAELEMDALRESNEVPDNWPDRYDPPDRSNRFETK